MLLEPILKDAFYFHNSLEIVMAVDFFFQLFLSLNKQEDLFSLEKVEAFRKDHYRMIANIADRLQAVHLCLQL